MHGTRKGSKVCPATKGAALAEPSHPNTLRSTSMKISGPRWSVTRRRPVSPSYCPESNAWPEDPARGRPLTTPAGYQKYSGRGGSDRQDFASLRTHTTLDTCSGFSALFKLPGSGTTLFDEGSTLGCDPNALDRVLSVEKSPTRYPGPAV